MLIEYHRTMLADRVRNEAFHAALKECVAPGKSVVADIGCGTGLLGFMASKLGAKEVHCFEVAEIVHLALELAKQNRIRNCHFYHDHSTNILDPTPVDLVVTETLGNYAYEENIIETANDALRFLKPGGTVIPRRINQLVAPVVTERFKHELDVWDEVGFGLDFAAAKRTTLNNMYVRHVTPADLLPAPDAIQQWDFVELTKKNKSVRHGEGRWNLTTETAVHGFALFWEAELAPGVSLSTRPDAPRTHWDQLYLPLLEPIAARAGDKLAIRIDSDSRGEGVTVKWQVNHTSGGQTRTQSLDIQKGFVG
jgi:protein arginine N-methyltransferase 1